MEPRGDGVFFSVTLPNILVGTVGGGTGITISSRSSQNSRIKRRGQSQSFGRTGRIPVSLRRIVNSGRDRGRPLYARSQPVGPQTMTADKSSDPARPVASPLGLSARAFSSVEDPYHGRVFLRRHIKRVGAAGGAAIARAQHIPGCHFFSVCHIFSNARLRRNERPRNRQAVSTGTAPYRAGSSL